MYRLLVVDDEPLHRRGIADMVKALRPNYIVFVAKDGEQALGIANANVLDIILTDIRMPRMDGLQLIERLGNRTESIKVVILSAYSHFEYARRALKFGAFDYLLKPIEYEDLAEMLEKLELALEIEHQKSAEQAELQRRLQFSVPVYEQHLVQRWLTHTLEGGEHAEIAQWLMGFTSGHVLLANFVRQAGEPVLTPGEWNEVRERASQRLVRRLQTISRARAIFLEEPDLAIVVAPLAGSTPQQEDGSGYLDMTLQEIQAELPLTLSIGIGGPCSNLVDEGHRSYEQARRSLDFAFYAGTGKAIVYTAESCASDSPIARTIHAEARIGSALKQVQRAQALDAIEMVFAELLQGGLPVPHRLKERILDLLISQVRTVELLVGNEKAGNLIAEMQSQIPACRSLDTLRVQAAAHVLQIIESIENRKSTRADTIVAMCVAYCNEHYMEDLSLEMLAKRYFFSPAYFSSMFKAHTFMTFTDYLLQVRVEKSKQLLLDPGLKVADVAQQVGFRDPGYFARIFRRETGLSPDEYRKSRV